MAIARFATTFEVLACSTQLGLKVRATRFLNNVEI
jgi:hypothetical protein